MSIATSIAEKIMRMVLHCDEKPGSDGMCDCGRYILETVQGLLNSTDASIKRERLCREKISEIKRWFERHGTDIEIHNGGVALGLDDYEKQPLNVYVFDRYCCGRKMAEGARVQAFSESSALHKAQALFTDEDGFPTNSDFKLIRVRNL